MTRNWLTHRIFTIDGVLSPDECARLVAHSELRAYDEAPITTARGPVFDRGIRDNTRVMEDDPQTAAWLWGRIAPMGPPPVGPLPPIGLNERLRYYRYDVGQRFAPHFDGYYQRPTGERSRWTLMVYLNDDFEGGETNFFLVKPGEEVTVVKPRTGRALLFEHHQLHEGAAVRAGRKYALRTDVMYAATLAR